MPNHLVLADAQFTGFRAAQDNNDIISLVTAMGLDEDEWEALKKKKYLGAESLTDKNKREIEEYFKNKSK